MLLKTVMKNKEKEDEPADRFTVSEAFLFLRQYRTILRNSPKTRRKRVVPETKGTHEPARVMCWKPIQIETNETKQTKTVSRAQMIIIVQVQSCFVENDPSLVIF